MVIAMFMAALKGFLLPAITIVFGRMINDLLVSDGMINMDTFAYVYIGLGFRKFTFYFHTCFP